MLSPEFTPGCISTRCLIGRRRRRSNSSPNRGGGPRSGGGAPSTTPYVLGRNVAPIGFTQRPQRNEEAQRGCAWGHAIACPRLSARGMMEIGDLVRCHRNASRPGSVLRWGDRKFASAITSVKSICQIVQTNHRQKEKLKRNKGRNKPANVAQAKSQNSFLK